MRDLHVIYTDYTGQGYGWGIESPQIPGLSAGRPTIDGALTDTEAILELAGWAAGTYTLHQHEQKVATSPAGNEFLLRFVGVDDPYEEARAAVIGRELFSVEHGKFEDGGDLERMPVMLTGERLVIAVVPSDRLGWILDQLGAGDGAIAVYYAGGDALYSVPIFTSDLGKGTNLDVLGLDRASTVADVFDAVMADEAAKLTVRVEHVADVKV